MAYRSGCVAVQLGDDTSETAVAITTATPSAGIVTIAATAIGASPGDIVQVVGSTGLVNFNSYHIVSTAADANTLTIVNGNITGTLVTPGTVQRMNTTWTTISEVATLNFDQTYNVSEAPSLDDCTGIIEKVATTVSGSGSIVLNWLPADTTQGMVSGLSKLADGRGTVWIRAQNNAYSETTPTYEGFMAIINNYARSFESGTHQQLTLGLDLNTVIMRSE